MNTQDPQSEKGLFALFKGHSGSGKSVAALSFPDPYVFDFDRKMPAIALKHFPKKSIEFDHFEDMMAVSDQISAWLQGTPCPYETLIYDSITSFARLIMNSVGQIKGESTPQILRNVQTTRGGNKQIEMLSIDYYNAEVRMIDWILTANKILWARPEWPKHIIFIAHIVTTESAPDLKTKIVTKTRSIMTAGRKAAAIVPQEFDEIYLFGHKEEGGMAGETEYVKHFACTESVGEDDAKTAYKFDKYIDFTNASFYDLLQKQINGQKFMASL